MFDDCIVKLLKKCDIIKINLICIIYNNFKYPYNKIFFNKKFYI